jgi:hypothetical protein
VRHRRRPPGSPRGEDVVQCHVLSDQLVVIGRGRLIAAESSAHLRGSLGLAVLLVHAGGDGDYVLVHTWIEGYMSDLAVFVGPAGDAARLRPGRSGLAPCVWEAAVLAHERDAVTRHVLDGRGALDERLAAWRGDVLEGEVR